MSQRWVIPLASHSMRLVRGSVDGVRDMSGRYASVCKVPDKEIPRCDAFLGRREHKLLIWGQRHDGRTCSSISSVVP